MNPTRRLAAIPAADVVGYSRLMDQDEAGTLATLWRGKGAAAYLASDAALVHERAVPDAGWGDTVR